MIAIGLPVYNSIKTVKKSIESLLNQSYEDILIVIYDDYSSDGTFDYLKQNFISDKIKYLKKSSQKIGLIAAWNKIAAYAYKNGFKEFIWCSDHDWYNEDYILNLKITKDKSNAILAYPKSIDYVNSTYQESQKFNIDFEILDSDTKKLILNKRIFYGNIIYGLFDLKTLNKLGYLPSCIMSDRLLLQFIFTQGSVKFAKKAIRYQEQNKQICFNNEVKRQIEYHLPGNLNKKKNFEFYLEMYLNQTLLIMDKLNLNPCKKWFIYACMYEITEKLIRRLKLEYFNTSNIFIHLILLDKIKKSKQTNYKTKIRDFFEKYIIYK